LTVKRWTCR